MENKTMLINFQEKLKKFKTIVEKNEKGSRLVELFFSIINNIEPTSLEWNNEKAYSSSGKDPNLIVTNLRFRQNQKQYLIVAFFSDDRDSVKYFLQIWDMQPARMLKKEEIIKMFSHLIYYINLL